MNKSLKHNLFWDYFNRFGNTVFSLITSIILARILSPADYGLVGIAMAVNGIGGIFLNLGFVSAIIQSKEIDNKALSTAFYLNIGIAIIIYFCIFFAAPSISKYYNINELALILKITAITFIFSALSLIPSAILMREMNFKKLAIIGLFSSILGGVIGIIMALNGFGVWSIVFQQITTAILSMLGYYLVAEWLPILYFNIKSIQSMLKFGVFMFLSGVLDSVYSKIDIFLIAKLFSPVSLGYYTRAQGLDSTIRTLSSGSLLNVLFPTFAKIREDKVELKKLYYQYFELISFLFCLLGGVFYLGADQLFFILFGSKWAISATYFKILILAGFAYPLSSLSLSIMEARGNSKNFFIVEILKKILFFPTYIIAYYYGINYFLYSFVLACFIGTFFNVRFAKFEIDIDVSETIVILLKYLFSSFIFILFFTIYGKSFLVNFPFIQTTVQIVLFLILYLFTHFIFKNAGIKFLLEIIKSRK